MSEMLTRDPHDPRLYIVDMQQVFHASLLHLDASEVRALADWIDLVTGGGNDVAHQLRSSVQTYTLGL